MGACVGRGVQEMLGEALGDAREGDEWMWRLEERRVG